MGTKAKTKEGKVAYDTYWKWMDSGQGGFDYVAKSVLDSHYAELKELLTIEADLLKKSTDALQKIRSLLEDSSGEVTKEAKWWYKEREKTLIELSKVRIKINKSKENLLK